VWLIADGQVVQTRLDPIGLGLTPVTREDLVGGDPAHNAGVVRSVLSGTPGPVRDIVALNAAAAQLAFAGPDLAAPVAAQFVGPLERAYQAIDSGAAAGVLDTWVEATRAAKPA
jgi:anthranilate phosphoribosyltransferase